MSLETRIEEAIDMALGAQEEGERVAASVETLLQRTARLEQALRQLLAGHPRGASAILNLDPQTFAGSSG